MSIGTVIAGTYVLESLIGRGGMGDVFLASHNRLPGKQVAIKFLHAELTTDDVVARFKREAQIASQLGHPNIVEVDDYNVTADGTPYLILEYLRGMSLAQRLQAGPMTLAATSSILRQIGSALAVAHRANIIHRDLKPQNIYLVETEVDGRAVEIAKVLDFGISKILGSETVKTQETSLLGTPQYMAPEQATGQHSAIDERTDVFALGAIAYEMLCGTPAFGGASIPEVVFKVVYEPAPSLAERAPALPASVIEAIEKAMAKPSAARWPTVSAFVEALTGQPLVTTLRGKATALPPDSGFAATVDSGNRVLSTPPAAITPSTPMISPMAATVAASATSSAQLAHVATSVKSEPPAKSRRLWVVAAVVGTAVLAGYIGHATRSGGNARRESREQVATLSPTPDAAVPVVADAAIVGDAPGAVDADVATKPAVKPPNKPVVAKLVVTRPVVRHPAIDPPLPADDPDSHRETVTTLATAMAAVTSGQYAEAEKLARLVLHTDGVVPAQRQKAHWVLAKAACAQRHQDDYNSHRANIGTFRVRELAKFCAPYSEP